MEDDETADHIITMADVMGNEEVASCIVNQADLPTKVNLSCSCTEWKAAVRASTKHRIASTLFTIQDVSARLTIGQIIRALPASSPRLEDCFDQHCLIWHASSQPDASKIKHEFGVLARSLIAKYGAELAKDLSRLFCRDWAKTRKMRDMEAQGPRPVRTVVLLPDTCSACARHHFAWLA